MTRLWQSFRSLLSNCLKLFLSADHQRQHLEYVEFLYYFLSSMIGDHINISQNLLVSGQICHLWFVVHFSNVIFHGFPLNIYLFKVNNRNTRKRWKICSKLTIKTPERCHWRHSIIFIVNFEHISHLYLVFLLLPLNR